MTHKELCHCHLLSALKYDLTWPVDHQDWMTDSFSTIGTIILYLVCMKRRKNNRDENTEMERLQRKYKKKIKIWNSKKWKC